ncbi:NTP transferase domain-containing protein [Methylobacterium longum]|uniref:NTP transferase domain-containing protein n=1 Tax=Methylobacterium longum TaxID=767694 RepID=A0ABT8AXB1_9HYPH|nr:NTP transferase domain-containing protein [Methylobacterium longum]MDN3574562.1 NTP transferase domain-containing protein [Methylobacterium longum]GJE14823.1 2-C-methyl-D-erythritol 4-phosphate cytidylyltransferase [Methylobacterium longum]
MQIVIPMSGAGERFRRAGYTLPKPLIVVEDKPIIAHVIDLFPGETNFVFVCNQDHLDNSEYGMAETLRKYCPTGKIVGVEGKKLGPIAAVLDAREHISLDEEVFVNYCDFTCYWDWEDFKSFVTEVRCDGAVPAYRGFHPHSIDSIYYAFMSEKGLWMQDIQEKKPFTNNPIDEFASSGGYYFRSGRICLEAFDAVVAQNLEVNGEFYVSLAYKILAQRGQRVAIYELQHFMQWGTPQDVAEYNVWSRNFRRILTMLPRTPVQEGTLLIPMAGLGMRFAERGYAIPKPLLDLSGLPMVLQAFYSLPEAAGAKFVLRGDMPGHAEIASMLQEGVPGATITLLDSVTEGQAVTCAAGAEGLNDDIPMTIGACDNGLIFDAAALDALLSSDGPDLIVWTVRGHRPALSKPTSYGWVETDENGRVLAVRVKMKPEDASTAPMIVGAFTFRRIADFRSAYKRLVERDGRINGEFYVDSMVEDALAMGLDCRIFDVDCYLGWGTPNEYEAFRYWQSCFHKWSGHPYRIELDPMVPPDRRAAIAAAVASVSPPRPSPH